MNDLLAQLGVAFTPHAWLAHVLLGLAIQLAVALPLRRAGVGAAWWVGAAVSIGFWWGREKVEFEFALKAAAGLRTLGPFWHRGWLPFEWDVASQLQFFAPAAVNLALAALAARRRRGRRPVDTPTPAA
ncbi:MAG: hypothetical protein JO021_12585 [Alphaproteobacteria bacterium]|nr:hypothetical protein [Alphaproteobacteria bacterium]